VNLQNARCNDKNKNTRGNISATENLFPSGIAFLKGSNVSEESDICNCRVVL
jgi:hypothetical protein